MSEVTLMLEAVRDGESGAEDRLWQTVYHELRRMAGEKMAGESRQITLQATALVHEVWLRLSGSNGTAPGWDGRSHFFAAAGEAMRRILVDQARRRLTEKRGGRRQQVPLEEAVSIGAVEDTKVLLVHDVLDELAEKDIQQAQIVKLCFFIGLSQKEAGVLLGVSEKTVQRQWILAKAWLFQAIKAARMAGNSEADNHWVP
jgi:RNA polymerase sigma factor (TIGR02999 family)